MNFCKDFDNCCMSFTLWYSSRPTNRSWSCQLGCISALSVEASPPLLLARSLGVQWLWLAGRLVSPCTKRNSFNLKHLHIPKATSLLLGVTKVSHSEQNIYPFLSSRDLAEHVLKTIILFSLKCHQSPPKLFKRQYKDNRIIIYFECKISSWNRAYIIHLML